MQLRAVFNNIFDAETASMLQRELFLDRRLGYVWWDERKLTPSSQIIGSMVSSNVVKIQSGIEQLQALLEADLSSFPSTVALGKTVDTRLVLVNACSLLCDAFGSRTSKVCDHKLCKFN